MDGNISAAVALAAAQAAGVTLRVSSGKLRLEWFNKPPAELIDLIKENKPGIIELLLPVATVATASDPDQDFEERAAIAEHEDGLPREIAEGLARLEMMPPPNGSRSWWEQIINGAAIFADRWGARALELGWQPIELFGIHPVAPAARHDCLGLAFMLDGGEVVDIDADKATLIKPSGAMQSYYRWRDDPGAKMAWEVKS